jgi:hypothetical protein
MAEAAVPLHAVKLTRFTANGALLLATDPCPGLGDPPYWPVVPQRNIIESLRKRVIVAKLESPPNWMKLP